MSTKSKSTPRSTSKTAPAAAKKQAATAKKAPARKTAAAPAPASKTKSAAAKPKAKAQGGAVVVLVGHARYGEQLPDGSWRAFERNQPVRVSAAEADRLGRVGVSELPGHLHGEAQFRPAFATFSSVATYEAAARAAGQRADRQRRDAARREAERILREAMIPRPVATVKTFGSLEEG